MKAFSAEQLVGAERQVAEACRKHHVYAIIGTPYRERDKLYNSAAIINPRVLNPARPSSGLIRRQQLILRRMGVVAPPEESVADWRNLHIPAAQPSRGQ